MHNIKPTNAQKSWMNLGYGMFIHFGPNTIQGKAWGDGKFEIENFNFKNLDIKQWAAVASEAGMKYAVLTTKHHDGFCLWPSKFTEYSVKNSPLGQDVVELFVKEFNKVGIKTGLYYSLWDNNFSFYEEDDKYFEYMKNQLTELLTNYGDILELWFDGGWDKDYPSRTWEGYRNISETERKNLGQRWRWKELYEFIHILQPQCLVINNSSSDYPGVVKYHPVDVRTSEHFDFIYNEHICFPELNPIIEEENGGKVFIPLEFCTSLNPDWFWTGRSHMLHPSVDAICSWYKTARNNEANLLLNVGPNAQGLIPDYHIHFLREAAKILFNKTY